MPLGSISLRRGLGLLLVALIVLICFAIVSQVGDPLRPHYAVEVAALFFIGPFYVTLIAGPGTIAWGFLHR